MVVAVAITGDLLWFAKSEKAATAGVTAVPEGIANQLATLVPQAQNFNQEVLMIQSIESSLQPKSAVIARFEAVAASSSVTLTRITVAGQGSPVTLAGAAVSEEAIVAFKNALVSNALAKSVTLPFSGIQPAGSGFTFAMTANQ
jgi:Tfp pilus assembly protein PilN